MRIAVVALVAAVVGFGAGWLVFGSSGDSTPSDPSDSIANNLLRKLRADGLGTADSATCSQRQADTAYLCTVVFGMDGGTASDAGTFIVRVNGDQVVGYRHQ